MEEDIKSWIGTGRTVEAMACDDITLFARAVLAAFWAAYPAHETQVEAEAIAQLDAMATVAGVEGYARLIGGATMESSGTMTLEMVPELV